MSMISELVEELIDNADLYTKELHDLMYEAADTIEMLSEKAREPKQEWIPCSERLPKEEGIYLVTATNYIFNTEEIVAGTCYFNIEYGFSNNRKILAWQPLPEPWEGADEPQTEGESDEDILHMQ